MKKVLFAILILILTNEIRRKQVDFKKHPFSIIKSKEVIDKLLKIILILVLMIENYKDLVIHLIKKTNS